MLLLNLAACEAQQLLAYLLLACDAAATGTVALCVLASACRVVMAKPASEMMYLHTISISQLEA